MKRTALTTLAAATGVLISISAAAAMDDATKEALATCQASKTTPQKGIEACTKVLDGVKLGPKSSLQLHYNRGAFYLAAGNTDKAVEDFTTAINAYKDDADKANWPADFVSVAASAYAFRAEAELKQKKCEAAKADYQEAAATSREVSQREEYDRVARSLCK